MPGGERASGLGGVIGAPVTPFTGANTVDLDTAERLCDFLVAHGVHGVALSRLSVPHPPVRSAGGRTAND